MKKREGLRWSHLLFTLVLAAIGLRAFVTPQPRFAGQEELQILEDGLASNLKVYVYDLPSKYNKQVLQKDLRCLSHMFATEIYIHLFLLSSAVRTFNPAEANWFYTPVYTNCDLTKTGLPLIEKMPQMVSSAVHYISTKWPYWNRTGGADHFFVVPHDFGACFHFQEKKAIKRGILPLLSHATLIQTFGQNYHACLKNGSIIIPPYVPPSRILQHTMPVDTPRTVFAYFRGVFYDLENDPKGGHYARGIRGMIWENFKDNPLFDISIEDPQTYYEDMQRSIFCLCPLGWAPWSPRIVEAVQFGCIPVIIADEIVLPFHEVIPWKEISVFVKEENVTRLGTILTSISKEEILRKQELLADKKLRRALLFPRFAEFGDGYHQIMHALARKVPHPKEIYETGPQAQLWAANSQT